MIDATRFEGRIEAHLWYVISRPIEEAVEILRGYLASGGWEKHPHVWWNSSRLVAERGDQTWTQAIAARELCARLMEHRVDDDKAAHAVLDHVFRDAAELFAAGTDDALLGELVAWFTREGIARPGDAAVAAKALMQIRHKCDASAAQREAFLAAVYPMARWLLQNGAAELRTDQSAPLIPFLVEATLTCEPTAVASALNYALANDPRRHVWFPDDCNLAWRAAETAMEHGWGPTLASEFVRSLPVWDWNDRLRPLLPGEARYPRVRAALLRGLLRGAFSEHLQEEAWKRAILADPPSTGELRIDSITSLECAFDVVRDHLFHSAKNLPPTIVAWARVIVAEFARVHDLADDRPGTNAARNRLTMLVARSPAMDEAVADGLLAGIDPGGDDPRADLVRELLGERPLGRGVVKAALHAFPARARRTSEAPAEQVEDLRRWIEGLLHLPWHEPVGGVRNAELLRGARLVEFAKLDNENKVEVAGDIVRLDRDTMESIARIADVERRRALGSLYFLHELIHLDQGIGAKDTVAIVRSTGAELTLLRIDQMADHLAAMAAMRATPRWSLAWLKDVQGRAQAKYPATWMHTSASRTRKALRVVSLRLDHLVRTERVVPADRIGDGFIYADHGPAGGHLLALGSGPPERVLFTRALAASDAVALSAAADEGHGDERGVAEIDALLRRVVAAQGHG